MSAKMQAIVAWFGVPVPPLSVGLLFLLVWLVFRIIMLPYADLAGDETKAIREWKEAGYAAAYLVLALGFLITRQRRDPAGQLSSARADP
jgi:hypothetical protein